MQTEYNQAGCLKIIMVWICLCGLWINALAAAEYFDPAALELSSEQQNTTDLSYFAQQGEQLPGRYRVEVYVNQQRIDTASLSFVRVAHQLQPELTLAYLRELGVNTAASAALASLTEQEPITDLGRYIPSAFTRFDFAAQRLDISIPQVAMRQASRDVVPMALWDDGIPAAFVDYTFSGSSNHSQQGSTASYFLNLRSGANAGPWRLRNLASYQSGHWQSRASWLQRDLRGLRSQLRLGESYTSGLLFNSMSFQGLSLVSDDAMLPDSERGFAPTLHGVAHSNARVTVRQHGYIIYETYVAPGAFAIEDLQPTTQSGDLLVTVRESDGSETHFTQPYAAVPLM
ncbi:MAG: fimbria/pilus outer membrane usher protein, partial [Aeromonadaceae bacterium]